MAVWYQYVGLTQEITGIVIFQTGFVVRSVTPMPHSPFEPFFDFIDAAKIGVVF